MKRRRLLPLTTLGAWLAFAFSALSVLLTLLLALVIERTVSRDVAANIGSSLAELAQQTASRLDRGLFERHREILLMSERLRDADTWREVQADLDATRNSYRYYLWLGLTDEKGVVQAGSGGARKGDDVSQTPWFRSARAGNHLVDVHSGELPGASDGLPRQFDIAFPVQGTGITNGVLAAHVSWEWAKDVRQVIFGAAARRMDPLIVAADGSVLLGPPDAEGGKLQLASLQRAQARERGYLIEQWPNGQKYLVGFARSNGFLGSPGLGWYVLVRQELGTAYAPLRELQQRIAIAGALLAILFSIIGWFAARAVTRPLKELTAAARRLESGDPVEVPTSHGYREVEVLGTALKSMVERLHSKGDELATLNGQLEQRVQQRTAELQEAFERVQANEHRVQTIIESAQDPFIGTDLDGRVTDWSSRAEAVFGWAREEVVGRRISEVLVPPRYATNVEVTLEQVRRTGHSAALNRPVERVMIDRQGREFPVELRLGLVSTGEQRFFTAFVHDISRRKEVERMKDEFISTVSHELRTPLTAIYGSLNLLTSGMAGELPPDVMQLLTISHESTERLIRLINEMLDLEKIASGKIEYRMAAQPLRPLLEQAIRDTGAYAESMRVQFHLLPGADARIYGDADRLVQVCVNLLSNAAKFSPPGGEVEITLQVDEGKARVAVADHGPGVPPEFHERIFQRFAQADASDRRAQGGTGLGLAICRSIIEAHGGRMGFTSEPDVRTEFFFELPLA
ncbi:sensor histidine kinase [Ramlibacter agri]|nr:ATP-binding protein [Ramlibacter agri]